MAGFRVQIDFGATKETLKTLQSLQGFKLGIFQAGYYVINILRKETPSQKYVSRKEAYGSVFFSQVQQKAFFAKLDSGQIITPYPRKGGLDKGYYVDENKSSGVVFIGNHRRYAKLVIDLFKQSRMQALIGWQTVQAVMSREKQNIQRIIRDSILDSLK